jgi:hypothetical protein
MITALCDEYPRLLGRHREIFVAVLLTAIYICALPTTTYVGTASGCAGSSLDLPKVWGARFLVGEYKHIEIEE